MNLKKTLCVTLATVTLGTILSSVCGAECGWNELR